MPNTTDTALGTARVENACRLWQAPGLRLCTFLLAAAAATFSPVVAAAKAAVVGDYQPKVISEIFSYPEYGGCDVMLQGAQNANVNLLLDC